MSIGNTVVISLPALGTTVKTLAKAKDGVYLIDVTDGTNTAPYVLNLRESARTSTFRSLSGTFRYNPSMNDSPAAIPCGRVSVSINCNAQLGSILDRGELLNCIRYALSAMLQANLLEALVDGSLE